MKKDRDAEFQREIRTHLDLEAEERLSNGMSETEARYAARRAFGNVTRTQEDMRAVWTRGRLEEASRMLGRPLAGCRALADGLCEKGHDLRALVRG